MMLAQGLAEYGALSGALSGIDTFLGGIEDTVRDAGPGTWVAVFIGVLIAWFVFLRR